MKASILLEIQYLAPVQYYTKLLKYPKITIEQHENYRKGSFRNRCCIATANGVLPLSIPLQKGKNQQTNIREIKIDNTNNWQLMHWRSICTAYGKSPFFEYYQDELFPIYENKKDFLFDFCLEAQAIVLEILQFSPAIKLSELYQKEVDISTLDFRNKLLPKNYQNTEDPHFKEIPYLQVFGDRLGFLPNLSILDLLFCTGTEALSYIHKGAL